MADAIATIEEVTGGPLKRLTEAEARVLPPAQLLGLAAAEGIVNLYMLVTLPKPEDGPEGSYMNEATKRLRLIGDMSLAANRLLMTASGKERQDDVLKALLDLIRKEEARSPG